MRKKSLATIEKEFSFFTQRINEYIYRKYKPYVERYSRVRDEERKRIASEIAHKIEKDFVKYDIETAVGLDRYSISSNCDIVIGINLDDRMYNKRYHECKIDLEQRCSEKRKLISELEQWRDKCVRAKSGGDMPEPFVVPHVENEDVC